jgi:hypothetical protein
MTLPPSSISPLLEVSALYCSVHIEISAVMLPYIAFPGSEVGQDDCRMWNISYKYKSICTIQLKFSHKKTLWLHIRLFKNMSTHIYINTVNLCYLHNL